MKVQIRRRVFETNSSSVHSISICDKDNYDGWISGRLMYNPVYNTFLETPKAQQYNIENFNKDNYYYADLDIFSEDDLKIPLIIEILYAFEFSESGYVDAYFTYNRFFKAAEKLLSDNYKKIKNIKGNSVEFGYTGRN